MLTRITALAPFAALVLLVASAAAADAPAASQARATVATSPLEDSVALAAGRVDAERAWSTLGCSGCHDDDGAYRDEIKGALGKPVDQVARWIRNAPSIKPDTDMPSFEGLVDEPTSLALAAWVLERAAHLE